MTTVSKGNHINYVMDWGNAIDTGDYAAASGETVEVTHEWSTPGTYQVKAQAIRDDDPKKASDFSPAKSVKVVLNQRPVVDSVLIPPVAVKDVPTNITVYGHDDDGDSLRAIVKWPQGDTTTELTPSPCAFTVTDSFKDVGTAQVIVWVQDWKKAKSLPDTVLIPVGKEGGVKWYWQSPVEGGNMSTSALVAINGTVEVVMSASWDELKFFQIRASNGKNLKNATTKYGEDDFTGGPALCAATGNVIVGGDDGELYALSLADLSHVWEWPNISPPESLTGISWGAPAINGSDIYVGREQDADSLYRLYKFTDNGASVTPGPAYALHDQGVVDAPAIDADGSVYFGTDSGYLIKIDKDLTSPLWRKHLIPNGEISGPIIGSDGTVYCCSDSPPTLYAVTPGPDSGVVKWTFLPDGFGGRPALGQSALFIGSDQGTVYSLDPNTGSINWQDTFPGGVSFNTTPVVAANGYVYFQGDNDVLYCLNQANGDRIWACDCNYYLPGGGRGAGRTRPRMLGLTDVDANPSITKDGDIIVVGQSALFSVAGYADRPLDPNAAWPKWQKDLSNTGKR
jgi:outer membrane protein assembly factor BamB